MGPWGGYIAGLLRLLGSKLAVLNCTLGLGDEAVQLRRPRLRRFHVRLTRLKIDLTETGNLIATGRDRNKCELGELLKLR